MKYLSILTGFLLSLSLSTYAASLSEYRKELGVSDEYRKEVLRNSAAILQSIDKSIKPNLSPLKQFNPAIRGSQRRITSSSLIKVQLEDIIDNLKQEMSYGKPITFMPSSTLDSLESDRIYRDSWRDKVKAMMSKVVDTRILRNAETNEKISESITLEERIYDAFYQIAKDRSSMDPIVYPATTELRQAVLRSTVSNGASVETIFGAVSGIEIQEGSVYALRFLRGKEITTISLSMLLTVFSDEDPAFIAALDYLTSTAKKRMELAGARVETYEELTSTRNWIKRQFDDDLETKKLRIDIVAERHRHEYYRTIYNFLSPKLKVAKKFNQNFIQLSSAAKRDLLETLLRVQQEEIPSAKEVGLLIPYIGKKINHALTSRGTQQQVQALQGDLNYFQQIQSQMARAKERLVEENATDRFVDKVIKDSIRGK